MTARTQSDRIQTTGETPAITPELIALHVQRARRLRSEYIGNLLRGLFRGRRRPAPPLAASQEGLTPPIGFGEAFRRDLLRDEAERMFVRDEIERSFVFQAGERHWSRAA